MPAGAAYADCCEPALDGAVWPATAEALMRSRYTAFARGNADHLFRTWYPRTRPAVVDVDPGTRWTGLHIRSTTGGSADDAEGTVEFTATSTSAGNGTAGSTGPPEVLRERSRFVRRAGRWMYVDAEGWAGRPGHCLCRLGAGWPA